MLMLVETGLFYQLCCHLVKFFSPVFLIPGYLEMVSVRTADLQSAEAPKVEDRGECSEGLGQSVSICM